METIYNYIAFEGLDGSGKSTQARLHANRVRGLLTREPGATAVGRKIRALLLDADDAMTPAAECLLMAADRNLHVDQLVRPALEAGLTVVSDRSVFSSYAYQVARGMSLQDVVAVNKVATSGLYPSTVVFIDVPSHQAGLRCASRSGRADRFESAGPTFQVSVAEAFRAARLASPTTRWIQIDGVGSVEQVAARVSDALSR